ncbi:hypothetical protein BDV95DRAFT_600464 [Massariosphaeria phaeospora]|uniref:Uncharacterized protein n=1 Tax=Massariosphaeria phaeospora TaxID=100035 RepID=A0A7C8MV55_9PLEO|nr:hypothetical protein BDV95DRAFT_600464 [Massariosphaeria phaeospora]
MARSKPASKPITISGPFDARHVGGVSIPGVQRPSVVAARVQHSVQRSLTLEPDQPPSHTNAATGTTEVPRRRANSFADSIRRPSLRLRTSISRLRSRSSSNSPDTGACRRKRGATLEGAEGGGAGDAAAEKRGGRARKASLSTLRTRQDSSAGLEALRIKHESERLVAAQSLVNPTPVQEPRLWNEPNRKMVLRPAPISIPKKTVQKPRSRNHADRTPVPQPTLDTPPGLARSSLPLRAWTSPSPPATQPSTQPSPSLHHHHHHHRRPPTTTTLPSTLPYPLIPRKPSPSPLRPTPKRTDSGTAIDFNHVPAEQRPLGFRDIMAVQSFAARMELYGRAREYWAVVDHGLGASSRGSPGASFIGIEFGLTADQREGVGMVFTIG